MYSKTDTSQRKVQAFFRLGRSFKVLAFNSAAQSFCEKILKKCLHEDAYFPSLFGNQSRKVEDKLDKAFGGSLEICHISFSSDLGSYQIFLSPVLDENDQFSSLSVSIKKLESQEDSLNGEKLMLQKIIDNIPDYIFVKDREHRSVLFNKKFSENILNKNQENIYKGQTPLDYFEEEKGKKIIADNEEVMRTGNPVINRSDVVITTSGKEERVLLTKVPLKNEENTVTGLIGIARDVTTAYNQEKKKALVFQIMKGFGDFEELKESMIHTLKQLCTRLGFDYGEAYKMSMDGNNLIRTAFWPEDQDLFGKERGSTYQVGEGLPGAVWESKNIQFIRGSNPLLNNMVLEGKGKIESAVGIPVIFQDRIVAILCLGSVKKDKEIEVDFLQEISIQIASVIEGKRSQDQLSNFFNYSLNLIAVVGLDGFVKVVNPSFEYKFGYSSDEILSRPFVDFVHPADLEKVYQAMNDLAVPDEKFEIRCRKKDGTYLWISWRFSRFFKDENIVYVFGTDITPLKEANAQLAVQIEEKNNIQTKLQLSEEKYKSLFNINPMPMWVLDREHLRFLSVNQAAIDLYGFSREEFLNMTVEDLWAPKQEKRIKKVVNDNKNDFFNVKVKHITKDGRFLYVSVKSNPLIYDGIKARVSLVNDITAMVKAEEKLRHSEKRFKSLVQEGSDLISIMDCNYNYIYNSPASKCVFGMDPGQMNATNFLDYIHKRDLPKVNEYLAGLKTHKRIQLPPYRIKNANDQWRWIETIITNLKNDDAVGGIVMNSRDITEFVKQKSQLLESVQRYEVVSKATSDIITDYDIEKDEVTVNKAATKMLGYAIDEIGKTGAWWDDKIHPEDLEGVKELARRMRRHKIRNLTTEYRMRCKDGSYKYILDRSYVITDDEENPKRIIGSLQDITERKKHLLAIEEHNRKLKEIAWTQSHVVRAPLAKVLGLVDLLLNYKNDLDNVDELLQNILNSAYELDKIIKQIATKTEEHL
ncbi:PAS domain S-box protein [Gramella sp. KN1008]|uniref:PAS domain S-box protein n=1 Tax=Gramella sp. KN1008 TaxID=2529298 RepID=UPI001038F598|nr:PAS domain S-box protein [Gramella sp. KN1008]TBW26434.1 PAS domain S-box protein [Gramella sp. KN1008]